MGRFGYLRSRIPTSGDPCLYEALLWEFTMLPQDDADVRWAIQHVRRRLAEAKKDGDRRSPAATGIPYMGIIENGPSRYDALEKHHAYIASLESLPQDNETVRAVLENAYRELAGALVEEAFFESGKRRRE